MNSHSEETLREFFAQVQQNDDASQESLFKKRDRGERRYKKLYKKYFKNNPSEAFRILFDEGMNGTANKYFVIDRWDPDDRNDDAYYYYQKDEKQSILDDAIEIARGMNESKSALRGAYSISQSAMKNISPVSEQKFSLPGIYVDAFELLDQCTNKKNRSAVIFQFINRFKDVIKKGQNLTDSLDVEHLTDIKTYYAGLQYLSNLILSNKDYLLNATTADGTWSQFQHSEQIAIKIMIFYSWSYTVNERRNKSRYGPLNDFFAKSLDYNFSVFQDDNEYDEEGLRSLFGMVDNRKSNSNKYSSAVRREEQFRMKREKISQENNTTETLREFFDQQNDKRIPILSEEEKKQFISAVAPITRGEAMSLEDSSHLGFELPTEKDVLNLLQEINSI